MNPSDLITMIERRAWVPLAALVVGFLVRLLKSDTKLPITIPGVYRMWVAFGLGVVSGVLEHVATGVSWTSAIVGGLVSAAFAALGHDALIGSLRAGRELAVPGLMLPGAPPAPGKPPTVPPTGPGADGE